MNDHRARPADLCMSDAMPWQQHWEYRTTLPLADILHERFFLPVRTTLRPGDSVTFCRYDMQDVTHKRCRLLEIATARVVASGEKAEAVPLFVIGGIQRIEPEASEAPKAKKAA